MKVAVTSRSFSKSRSLREKLLKKYPESYFNDQGKKISSEDLIEYLKPADAAIIALEKVNSPLLLALPNLKIISKYGVGLDNIDFQAIKNAKIKWGYTPGTNRRGVAELALQMMLILLRQSYQANLKMRQGEWSPLFGNNLTHKKIGILGLGHVGKDLVELLAPFKCQISCHEITPDKAFIKNNQIKEVSLEELFSENDIVTIHIPLDEKNKLLVNEKLLSLMQPHSLLINTARGGIVDEEALYQKLISEKIRAAGFDVFLSEPCTKKELLTLPNFYSTPHIGGSSVESIEAMGMAAINGLEQADFLP